MKKFNGLKIILFAIGAFLVLDLTVRLGIRIAVLSLIIYIFLFFIKSVKNLISRFLADDADNEEDNNKIYIEKNDKNTFKLNALSKSFSKKDKVNH